MLGVAEAAEHLPEDEQQEQRLQHDLGEEGRQFAPRDVEIAVKHGEEGTPPARTASCGRLNEPAQRSVLPVR
jgi:hypothetical protein